MIIELTDEDVMTLYSLLYRNTENHHSIQFQNEKDRQILWDLECLIEKQLPPDWEIVLEK